MRFMIIIKATRDSEAGKMPDEKLLAAMGKRLRAEFPTHRARGRRPQTVRHRKPCRNGRRSRSSCRSRDMSVPKSRRTRRKNSRPHRFCADKPGTA